MDIKINQKMIKEMCGTVSFKRGDAFYRTNKVAFTEYGPDRCTAIVKGAEDFHVHIEIKTNGKLKSTCTCPSLANFDKDCQHIAAVLIAIHEQQSEQPSEFSMTSTSENNNLTNDFMTLFLERPTRTSGHQRHFEKREVMDVRFTCTPVKVSSEQTLIGVEIEMNQIKIHDIRNFLKDLKLGKQGIISSHFTYDPNLHCFLHEADSLLQHLVKVTEDETIFLDMISGLSKYKASPEILLIPPSSWKGIISLFSKCPSVLLEYNGHSYEGLQIIQEPPPLQFSFEEGEESDYRLRIHGFNGMSILKPYHTVLSDGLLYQIEEEDCNRLLELKQMLASPGSNHIPIPKDQAHFFLKKIVPSLKKIGVIHMSQAISKEFMKTPLVAKLYLDRLRHKLLAGLEFHYENIIIQPLENRDLPTGPMIFRDVEKEDEILQIMDESGFSKTEGGYFMHNEELEYEFLFRIIPMLQPLCQIYATTAIRNRIVPKNEHPKIRVKIKKERTNWLEFKFEMKGIADQEIREILSALEEKRKYYRLKNGSLLSLETREMEEIQRFLHAVPIQDDDFEASLNMPMIEALPLLDSIDDSEIFTAEESFRQFLDSIRNPNDLSIEVPKHLDPILRDYQKIGFKWMKTLASYGFGGVLADDMGLGKTVQSIAFMVSELSTIRNRKQPVLIVCPSSLTYNWLHELLKFAPELQAIVIDGDKTERKELQKESEHMDVLITSYPLLRRDIKWYESQHFHSVFFDEAQAFKNSVTQTARAVKRIKAAHRFGLTGTPVENSIEELWSIYHVVFPQLFKGLKEYSHLTRKDIARRVRPFLLRRVKEEVLAELPKKIEILESSELLPEQKKLYAAYLAKLRHDTLKHLDKGTIRKNKIRILAGLTRLRQICCHPSLFVEGYKGSSAKFEQLLQIIEESKLSGRRVLIFSQFTKMLELIGRELTKRDFTFFYLDGQTPTDERVELCGRYNAGERELFLISLKAGGTGLNLTGADTVILYDLWWNPAVEEQAADRAHRIGQKKVVQVIKLFARGTIEEKMNELQDKKRNLISDLIDSEENTTLSEEDIRELLMI
ncbi:DEAD/DEAH box helicase [Bacillus sp. JJ1533]|uniref:DEAD/DEAH box helicase n=1 Tax=Bacillus sp. JJ1533 TaxID=3122959 RepID=UPI0030001F23